MWNALDGSYTLWCLLLFFAKFFSPPKCMFCITQYPQENVKKKIKSRFTSVFVQAVKSNVHLEARVKSIRERTNISVALSWRVSSSQDWNVAVLFEAPLICAIFSPSRALCSVLWGSTVSEPPVKTLRRRFEGCASNAEQVSSSQTRRQGVRRANKAPRGTPLLLFT